MSGYMICTAPRSGSTLLCRLLRATQVAGWPESLFRGPTLEVWARRLDLRQETPSLDPILSAALDRGRSGGPVFGVRQQWPSFPLLLDSLAAERPEPTDRTRLEAALGPLRYVHLRRPNKLDQAISYIRAEQTGLWHRNADGSVYEAKEPGQDRGYDMAAIRAQIADFERQDAGWAAWFEAQGIVPLRLTYDALAANPIGTLQEVLQWIGLDPRHGAGVTAPTQKLADATSADWVARYQADTGNAGS